MRAHVSQRPVFSGHHVRRAAHFALQVGEDGQIVLSAILEDVALYLFVAFVGIVVERTQVFLGVFIDVDIVRQLFVVFLQRSTYADGKRHTDVPVDLGFRAQPVGVHLTEVYDEAVVAGNLAVGAVDKRTEGQHVLLKLGILLGGLVTGIGEVEDVFGFLRIEHQRVLVAAVHDCHELAKHALLLFFHQTGVAVELFVVVHQLHTQYRKGVVEIGLLQHSVCGRATEPCNGKSHQYISFHHRHVTNHFMRAKIQIFALIILFFYCFFVILLIERAPKCQERRNENDRYDTHCRQRQHQDPLGSGRQR